MPRPKIARQICGRPAKSCFKPNGRPMHQLEQITLAADEFEALRLVDLEGMQQQQAALVMGVSRQTLANILKKARYKVVECLSLGKALMMQPAEPDHQASGEDPT
ncbi:hypothetical protein A9R10_13200 [Aeromonas piscicola]|nr:hypothetical protein A9R10_13200 [Aeromonas piscicola]